MHAKTIAIVGGGPAGAFAATELANAGCEVLLFDEKLAWEKPCGGGLTEKAFARWPFLRDSPIAHNWIDCCELTAPSGRRVSFSLNRRIAILSRFSLNGFLLERARKAGAKLIRERVIEMGEGSGRWLIKSKQGAYQADFLVLAAGARNPFRRQFSGDVRPDNFMVAVGYYIPGTRHTVQITFLPGLHGYLWAFPRCDHFSVGICGRTRDGSTAQLRRTLESLLPGFGLNLDGAHFYAHIIPSYDSEALRNAKYCGDRWAIVGDAAGFVDAITGEGIYYALQSAELLSRAVLQNAPETYDALLRRELVPELELAARIADRFYAGNWMGGSAIERMVQLTGRSPQFRDLMRDLFAGAQGYADLKERVYRSLPKIAAEALVSTLWRGEASSPEVTHVDWKKCDNSLSFRAGFSREESAVQVSSSEKQIPVRLPPGGRSLGAGSRR